MTKTATRTDKLKEAHDRLVQAVESIVTGDDWKRMLQVSAKFHKYSFNNQLLIYLQRPDATYVAGFRRWLELKRFVLKGEKGIAILAPCRYKTKIEDEHGDEQTLTSIRGFRVVHVFDVSQTDGEPLDDLDAVRPKLLVGAAPDGLWDALVTQCGETGYDVVREQEGSENGRCDMLNKVIAVRPDVSDAQAVKTLIHELAHAMLHDGQAVASREIAEVEVESVAYIVSDALGLDTSRYSFNYIARWSNGDVDVIRSTMERAIRCAGHILTTLQLPTNQRAG